MMLTAVHRTSTSIPTRSRFNSASAEITHCSRFLFADNDDDMDSNVTAEAESTTDAPRWFDFQNLRRQWAVECGISSSLGVITGAPSYLRIIAMGQEAIPHILRELEDEGDDPDWWFTALEALTGGNPVPAHHRGNSQAMAADWLLWARGRYAW